MSKKKEEGKSAGFIVSFGFLLTFLFSNVILLIYALVSKLSDHRKNK